MSLKIQQEQFDFAQDKATLALRDAGGGMVSVMVKVASSGDQTESALKAQARKAAKALLQQAIDAL